MALEDREGQVVYQGLAPDVRIIEQRQEPGAQIKVAAYCRVSTNLEVQEQSLETQMAAFQRTISEHPGWVLAGIYADKGISGTSVKHREEFLRMIADAKAGKIQYILVKSISRFSRNTVDALRYVRDLKNYGVSVLFDKEKIDTGNAASEFLLSILAASAQEEIISLSNNVKVGRRMRNAAGITQWTRLYGFRRGENDDWIVVEDEAKVIRRIFHAYVDGRSLPDICRELESEGVPSTAGKAVWYPKTAAGILHNERYAGDLLMQKSFISDPINHTRVNNRDAKLKQYFKEDHHAAIVDRETYQMAVTIAAMKDMHRGTGQYPYYGFIQCPICGENMVRFNIPRNTRTFAWTCGGKPNDKGVLRKQRTNCPPYYIIEDYIDEAFLRSFQDMIAEYSEEGIDSKEIAELQRLKEKLENGQVRVEYKTLHDYVLRITFPRWTTMRIEWKNGTKTETQIQYRKIADQPYPTITRELMKRTRKNGKIFEAETYFVNGSPVLSTCPDRQIQGIENTRNDVQNLTILEARAYEPPVPRVFGRKTLCPSGNAEVAEVNREKLRKQKMKRLGEDTNDHSSHSEEGS